MKSAIALCLVFFTVGPSASAAEVYRWTDERGVVNYGNAPPEKTRGGTRATIVEDRVSVYTPDRATSEAIERSRDARRHPVAPRGSSTAEGEDTRRATSPPRMAGVPVIPPRSEPLSPPRVAYDPCFGVGDPTCSAYLYDGSPAFVGRRRAPHWVQPQIAPGTLAGHGAGPNAYIAGQSGAASPPLAERSAPPQRGSFTARGAEREYPRR